MNTIVSHAAPTEAGQTHQAWYVHMEGKSVSQYFEYMDRRLGDLALSTLLLTKTPYNPQALEITGLGYSDITIVFDDEIHARAMVETLARILPPASAAWQHDVDQVNVYAMLHDEVAEDDGQGNLFWVATEPASGDDIIITPTNLGPKGIR